MSSPIHQVEDLDPALRYAPRWARERNSSLPGRPLAPSPAKPLRRAGPEFSGDRAMVELQRQLILDPDAIPEPLPDDAGALRPIVLRFSAVMGLAALIAWGVVSLPGLKKAGEIMPPDVKAPALTTDTAKPVDVVQPQASGGSPPASQETVPVKDSARLGAAPLGPVVASIAPVPAIVATQPAAVPSQPIAMPPQPAAAPPAPSPPPAAPVSPAAVSTPSVDAAEIAALVKRGKDLFTSGDIVSARLVLRRAADAGSAEAALALGATFDPVVIRKLGAIGMPPDIGQARQWYQRAADLGSAEATGQLAKLEQTRP